MRGILYSKQKKCRALLCKQHKDIDVIFRVFRMSNKSITELVSHLISEESTMEQEEETKRALLFWHKGLFKAGIEWRKRGRKGRLAKHCLNNKAIPLLCEEEPSLEKLSDESW